MNLRYSSPLVLCICLAALAAPAGALAQVSFRRGDVNADGAVDLGDAVTELHFLFRGNPPSLVCRKAGDLNDDGALAIDDPVYVLHHLFAGGPPPMAPFDACGIDPTPDALPCGGFDACEQAAQDLGVRARVISQVVWPLEADELGNFTAEELETMLADGLEIGAGEARSRPLPLSGKYLEVGGARYMLDREGYAALPAPAGTEELTGIQVFWELADERSVATIETLKVAPLDAEPPETVIELTYRPPPDMNPPEDGGGGGVLCQLPVEVDGCPLRYIPPECPGTNAVPCCEDYLGPLGDKSPRWRFTNPHYPACPVDTACAARAYRNFVGSKCYEWVFNKRGKPCLPETVGEAFGGCWNRHKYRNCQNMDENALTITAAPAIKFGEKASVTVVNNTAANSTRLRIEPAAGKGDLNLGPGAPQVTLVPDGGGWRLDHWNDLRREHYESVELEYTAPDRDSTGKCVAKYKIVAEADGLTKEVEIRVMPKRNAWQGTTKRTSTTEVLGVRTEIVTDAFVLFDIDRGQITGTAVFTENQTAPRCILSGSNTTPIAPGPGTWLEVDFTNDPPRFRGQGASDFTVQLTQTCDGHPIAQTVQFPQEPWLDTVIGGRDFFTADDGCACADRNDTGVFGATRIIFDWDLKKLPDP